MLEKTLRKGLTEERTLPEALEEKSLDAMAAVAMTALNRVTAGNKELGDAALDFFERCQGQIFSNYKLSAVAAGMYALIGEYAGNLEPNLKISTAVEKLTPWEKYLCQWSRTEQSTLGVVEIAEGEPLDLGHTTKLTLLWLARNNGLFPNQPFDTCFNEKSGHIDPRVKTGAFKAAIRQDDGKYKVYSLKEGVGRNTEYSEDLFIEELDVESPENVQIIAENRAVAPASGWNLTEALPSPVIGIGMNNTGKAIFEINHLFMEGTAFQEMIDAVTTHARTQAKLTGEIPVDKETSQPLLTLDELCPSLEKLSPTKIMQAYARTMMRSGFDADRTIIIPQIGKFNDPKLDKMPEEGRKKDRRIQPVLVRLSDVAENPEKIKALLRATAEDVHKSALTDVFETLNDPRIPKPVQQFFSAGLTKLPNIGYLAQAFNSCGLISFPDKVDHTRDYKNGDPYGKKLRDVETLGGTMSSMTEPLAFNLTRQINSEGKYSFSLTGTPKYGTAARLRTFAKILEEEAANFIET
ncbi:MAG: hypothetical protein AAB443_04710 [Patescibacteria group bacterium]